MINAAFVFLAAVSITDVPNPRGRAGFISDMANAIDPQVESALNTRLASLKAVTGHEVMVVTVDDVNTDSPKSFATSLFNHWGIGSRERNDGLLVLLVVGQRRLEMETGIGMESRLPNDWLSALQANTMVPWFKRGDYGAGIAAGLEQVDTKLRGVAPLAATTAAPFPAASAVSAAPTPRDFLTKDPVTGAFVPASGVSAPIPAVVAPSSSAAKDALAVFGTLFAVVSGGASTIFGAFWIGRRMRRCPTCKMDTILLDELADDKHLTDAQRDEERLGSVDYKVYVCPGCAFSRTAASTKWFSGFSNCKGCRARTMKSTSTTLVNATYDHGGQVQVNESCARCPFRNTYTRSTPPRTRPSSTSSRSSFGSSSRSSSSSGGGRSRGGGSGSSW